MKNIFKNTGLLIAGCLLASALYSCNGNQTTSGAKCADSTATATTTTTTTDSSAAAAGANVNNNTGAEKAGANGNNAANGSNKMQKEGSRMAMERSTEPTSSVILNVTSPAFGAGGVIPVKYTCDGQGATPPLKIANIPSNTASLALIVHDYEATPEGGFTYWLIWNLDTSGTIPENFVNNHEGMNAAKQYGYTPICAKSGDHRYHFIIYALDTKLVMPKTTSKQGLERVMSGHVVGKGEVVGVYNKHLE